MLWRIIVTLWWIGVVVSFLVTAGMSAFALASPEIPAGERAGNVIGMWVRWVMGLLGGLVSLLVIWFVLGFVFGLDVPGITVEPR